MARGPRRDRLTDRVPLPDLIRNPEQYATLAVKLADALLLHLESDHATHVAVSGR